MDAVLAIILSICKKDKIYEPQKLPVILLVLKLTSTTSSISGVAGWEGGVGTGEGPGEFPNIGKSNLGRFSPSDSWSEARGVSSPFRILTAFLLLLPPKAKTMNEKMLLKLTKIHFTTLLWN